MRGSVRVLAATLTRYAEVVHAGLGEMRGATAPRLLLDNMTPEQVRERCEPFVATLPTRHAQITEPHIRPVWHQPWVFLLAIACLAGEWGLRRWKGMP